MCFEQFLCARYFSHSMIQVSLDLGRTVSFSSYHRQDIWGEVPCPGPPNKQESQVEFLSASIPWDRSFFWHPPKGSLIPELHPMKDATVGVQECRPVHTSASGLNSYKLPSFCTKSSELRYKEKFKVNGLQAWKDTINTISSNREPLFMSAQSSFRKRVSW